MTIKTLTFKYDDIIKVATCINSLNVTGINNFQLLSQVCDILNTGTVGEIFEKEAKENVDMAD